MLTYISEGYIASSFKFRGLSLVVFLLGLLFEPEDGADMFLRNAGRILRTYMGSERGR
jgi:hypothetical protein